MPKLTKKHFDEDYYQPLRYRALVAHREHLKRDGIDPLFHNREQMFRLLGMSDYEFYRETAKYAHLLEALAGPHGYAIYKMLKARADGLQR